MGKACREGSKVTLSPDVKMHRRNFCARRQRHLDVGAEGDCLPDAKIEGDRGGFRC